MAIKLNTEALRLFAEIGFMGLGRGQPGAAETIFAMYENQRPGEEVGAIGSAMTAMAADRADVALSHLQAAEQTPPIMAFSVIALARIGDKKRAAELVDDLKDMECDPALLEMCEAAIQ